MSRGNFDVDPCTPAYRYSIIYISVSKHMYMSTRMYCLPNLQKIKSARKCDIFESYIELPYLVTYTGIEHTRYVSVAIAAYTYEFTYSLVICGHNHVHIFSGPCKRIYACVKTHLCVLCAWIISLSLYIYIMHTYKYALISPNIQIYTSTNKNMH